MVTNEFLSRFLRSKIIVRQTKHLMTGNTLPRLQTRDIERLMIPIPPNEVQRRICAEARSRESAANVLRQEANAELESAKLEIEAILLGDAA
jgi:restriction endonuclease S subunit